MRLASLGLALVFAVGLTTMSRAAEAPEPTTLDVWPGPAPGEVGKIGEERARKKPGTEIVTNLTNVTKPTIKVYRPDPEKNMSMAMLVFPGGRPDFAVLVYPGGLIKRGSDRISPSVRVTLQTPPMFLVHASDDPGVENSVFLYLTLKRAGIPAELHIYGSGGHGFGVRPSNKPCATWTQRCEDWLRAQGLLKAAAKK